MGDLASAIVDLGRSAEERRQARRQLRESVSVVVAELLRHLRTGDTTFVQSEGTLFPSYAYYVVQQVAVNADPVKWETTLVRYPMDGDDGYLMRGEEYEGAVLHNPFDDSRSTIFARPEKHSHRSVLHRATDEELEAFCFQAREVVAAFRKHVEINARSMRQASAEVTALKIK